MIPVNAAIPPTFDLEPNAVTTHATMSDAAHRLLTDTDNGMLLIISGPSGVGKTTITRGVERSIADSVFSVSCTTRAQTPADVEGVDYHFVTDAQFEAMKADDEIGRAHV